MGSMPEVDVHPFRFRQKLQAAIEEKSVGYFTPQRAFAASMVFTLVIVCLTFGLFFYQQTIGIRNSSPSPSQAAPGVNEAGNMLTMETGVTASRFFNRSMFSERSSWVS